MVPHPLFTVCVCSSYFENRVIAKPWSLGPRVLFQLFGGLCRFWWEQQAFVLNFMLNHHWYLFFFPLVLVSPLAELSLPSQCLHFRSHVSVLFNFPLPADLPSLCLFRELLRVTADAHQNCLSRHVSGRERKTCFRKGKKDMFQEGKESWRSKKQMKYGAQNPDVLKWFHPGTIDVLK